MNKTALTRKFLKVPHLFVIAALLLFSPSAPPARATAMDPAALGSNLISPAPYVSADGTLSLPEGFSGSFDLEGWNVSLDPARGPLAEVAQRLAGSTSLARLVGTLDGLLK